MKSGTIDLSGRIALVTGGGNGIGATISLVLAQAGADIVVNYNTSESKANKIRDKIEALGRRAVVVKADVEDTGQCKELVRRGEEAFGRVDILASNAGIGQGNRLVDTTDEEWDHVMNVNVRATFALARELLPGMIQRKFGRFVTISSNVAVYGHGGASFSGYAASKAALIALTKSIAFEGAPYVTANAICPGPTDRRLPEERTEPIRISEGDQLNWLGIPYLVNRKGIPEDIAHAVAFFVSDAAEYITGQTLHVSGGLFMP